MNVNKVTLVGRLTRDPELRTTKSGQTVTSISIATNRFWKDQSGEKQEQTEFHNIVLFGRVAEVAGQYLVKGQEALFEGRLQTRSYTGKDNVERRVTEVVANEMQFGAKPQGAKGDGSYNAPAASQNSQPQQPQNQDQPAQPAKQAPQEEDIPTINLDEEQDEVKIGDVPF